MLKHEFILAVEDNEVMKALLGSILGALGYTNVELAGSAQTAKDIIHAKRAAGTMVRVLCIDGSVPFGDERDFEDGHSAYEASIEVVEELRSVEAEAQPEDQSTEMRPATVIYIGGTSLKITGIAADIDCQKPFKPRTIQETLSQVP